MARFDKYRSVLSGFEREIEAVAVHQNSEIDRARREYNKSVLNDKISEIKSEYAGSISSIRDTYLRQLDEATDSMRSRNSGKYRENYVDYDLLEKLNIISQSGVQLTSAELEAFTRTAMTSRSSFCVRKCQQMAKDSGFSLKVPSETAANDVIDETDKSIREIIKGYSGKPTSSKQANGHYMMLTVRVSGEFIGRLEKKYEDSTVEDITISYIDKTDYYKKKQKAEEDEEIEITEAGHLGITTKPTNTGSPALDYLAQLQPESTDDEE